jgi:beta-glucanase (GH16 family)
LSAPTSSSPVLFHDTFSANTPSSAWSFASGTWQINKGVLSQTSTAAADPKKAMITNLTYPSNLMITAEVQVNSWNAGDMARAGVGLYTNPSTGNGYNLVFHGADHVQFLDDRVTWGNAYTFHWQVGTWYWFQLAELNGTLEGKVWAAGTAEPQSWMFQQTGWTDRTGGAPALNGGSASASAGSSTVSFASVSVTTTSVQPDTASAGSASTLPSPIAGTNYQLVFDDEFHGTSINPANWNEIGPWGEPVASDRANFSYPSLSGNMSNVSEANGATITARNTGGGYTGTWTGGILSTNGLHQWEYGYYSVTAKLPAGQGFWPAIWLYGSNSSSQELDMMESVGGGNTVYQTVHTASGQQYQAQTTGTNFTTGYNTYGMLWTPTSVTFYINGVETGSYNITINEPMYMMLDFDVAGTNDWGGPPNASTPTTAQFDISSVQVYQLS